MTPSSTTKKKLGVFHFGAKNRILFITTSKIEGYLHIVDDAVLGKKKIVPKQNKFRFVCVNIKNHFYSIENYY